MEEGNCIKTHKIGGFGGVMPPFGSPHGVPLSVLGFRQVPQRSVFPSFLSAAPILRLTLNTQRIETTEMLGIGKGGEAGKFETRN